MASKVDDTAPRKRTIRHKYVYGPQYVATQADGAVIQAKADTLGALVQILYTRIDYEVLSETVSVLQSGNTVTQNGIPQFDGHQRKVIECSVTMRPDHAVNIAIALLQHVSQLPEQIKAMYNIPEVPVQSPITGA